MEKQTVRIIEVEAKSLTGGRRYLVCARVCIYLQDEKREIIARISASLKRTLQS